MVVGVPQEESTKNGTLISKRTTIPVCKDHNYSELVSAWCATKSSMTVICANKDFPGTFTSDTIQCNGAEVCVDYFLTEKDAQAQCASSYLEWNNDNSYVPCSSTSSFGGGQTLDVFVGAATYDVDGNLIQVEEFAIYLNNKEIAATSNKHNVSTILRDYKRNDDGDFDSCFAFSGTARVTGYFAAFWGCSFKK
ncbi:uncharacterized protein OCT59_014868 [Rhizophagus irregularis]|nr:hypothetical protein RirG_216240 [Rhizophagus irregularis DAOM 197198w]EXX64772.1 hypothetical protein RirG_139600 [Rhizophagus irregularis DAOM 197198w]UZO22506.1 hypothetical protein OCT59_014868 [Rhizophagus irregularis]GBC43896.1 glycosyltransferase family 1 protein [Rhizophagus irregularis DAOM 181602=DAOM 197198]CAG8680874.1 2578_t:CDS:1 [Rhizophagus irregularis]